MKQLSIAAMTLLSAFVFPTESSADSVILKMSEINPEAVILPEIYGQFAEHLGPVFMEACGWDLNRLYLTLTVIATMCCKHCATLRCL